MEQTAEKPGFEETMRQLEAVVRKLESGEGTLDEMIRLYESGMGLVKECNARLDEYEAKIVRLTGTEEKNEQQAE